MRLFSCCSSSFDVGIFSRSSARKDARKRSSAEGGNSSVKSTASKVIGPRTGAPSGSAGFLLLRRALGGRAFPSSEQVRGLCEADDEGGQTREGEGGACDDAGVQDGTLRKQGHRIDRGSEPIEEEG